MTKPDARIVVVDDEQYICNIIEESLALENYQTTTFSEPGEAMHHIENNRVDLVLTDLMMGECTGVEILDHTLRHHRDAIVLIMTAHPTVQMAISVLKKGGYDFLVKPFKLDILRATIKRGLAHRRVLQENLQLKSQVEFLKVASAFGVGSDIDGYLEGILNSCRTEFSAVAAGLIEVDPVTGTVVRKLSASDDDTYVAELLDESHLAHFEGTQSLRPLVKKEKITIDGQAMSRVFVAKPIYVGDTRYGVIDLLLINRFQQVTPGQLDALSILTSSAASAMANHKLYEDLQNSYLEAISALAHAIEARDECTKGHTDRVVELAKLVAEELDWGDDRITTLVMGCTLHDIGKLGVPDCILNKPDKLTEAERQRMISHPEVGLKIVSGIELLKPAIPYISAHHERYDGNGYPNGLAGEDIPIEGRLLAVVDTVDAILSDRPYRKGAPLERALSELWDNRGKQFDPTIVEIFFRLIQAGKIDFELLYGREEDTGAVARIMAGETVRV